MIRKFSVLPLLGVAVAWATSAQPVFYEAFNYGAVSGSLAGLPGSPWTQTGSTATNPVQYDASGNLSFPGMSDLGGKLVFTNTGQDIVAPLPGAVNSGTLYLAMLVSISSANATGDYFAHFTQSAGATQFYGRVFVRSSGSNIQFGLMKNAGGSPNYANELFDLNTTYCLVLKYAFNTLASTSDDAADLYVFKAAEGLPVVEPASSLVRHDLNSDATSIAAVSIRQGTSSSAPAGSVDNMAVATSWAALSTYILPLQLRNFQVSANASGRVTANWQTLQESHMSHFEIERSSDGQQFVAAGRVAARNLPTVNTYTFNDGLRLGATTWYRLKMVEEDGSFNYSPVVLVHRISKSSLSLFPNPAGSQLMVRYAPASEAAQLRLYTADGRMVKTWPVQQQGLQTSVPVGDLPAGIYHVLLADGQAQSWSKFMKQ